ncbi:MAG: UDP-N-acetylmuramoylalanyl-D-glutamyl-2,6-diaminopimelate--D-alanyl-D-alanine ligase [Pseudomonadota bacterium]
MKKDTQPVWTLAAMREATGGRLVGAVDGGVTGISIDSRSIAAGEAYFAIKGDVHDGHSFVSAAARNGASVSVVAETKVPDLDDDHGVLLVVDDVLNALEKLGKAARARCKGQIIAITGSVGKTTTKEALRVALSACGTVHASVASFNNHWGVPLTLARMPEDTEYGIFEIGMNHPNEISPLVQMVRPHVAMINNVAPVHLGAFDSVDGIAHAKAEIFDGLDVDGTAVLNADDERIGMLSDIARAKGISRIVTFGESDGADIYCDKLVEHADCSCLTATVLGTQMMAKIGSPGRHIAQNALAVLAIVSLVGADLAKAGLALAHLAPVKGRGQRHTLTMKGGQAVLIDESYNANPASVRAMLTMLSTVEPTGRGRRIAVLGDMLELGTESSNLHAGLADYVLESGVDLVLLAGPEMKALRDALQGSVTVSHADDVNSLIPIVHDVLSDGDVIAVKASLGLRFGGLVDDLLTAYA